MRRLRGLGRASRSKPLHFQCLLHFPSHSKSNCLTLVVSPIHPFTLSDALTLHLTGSSTGCLGTRPVLTGSVFSCSRNSRTIGWYQCLPHDGRIELCVAFVKRSLWTERSILSRTMEASIGKFQVRPASHVTHFLFIRKHWLWQSCLWSIFLCCQPGVSVAGYGT